MARAADADGITCTRGEMLIGYRHSSEGRRCSMEKIRRLFGGLDLSWPRIAVSAVAAGVYTALVSILPQVQDTAILVSRALARTCSDAGTSSREGARARASR